MTNNINAEEVIEALGALAHEHRLALFRLARSGWRRRNASGRDCGGAGAAQLVAVLPPRPSNAFWSASSKPRQSRSLIYTADYAAMNGLVGYLIENCCGGEVVRPTQPVTPYPP